MESQQFYRFSFWSTWVIVLFLPSVCTGMDAPRMSLNSTVFVAFKKENLTVCCTLDLPVNQTADKLLCFNPSNEQIYKEDIQATQSIITVKKMLLFKNVTESGQYYCEYKRATVYWFLQVRDEGYKADHTEFIIRGTIAGVLLISSVLFSVIALRGHWKEKNTECDNTGRNEKQNNEEKVREIKEAKDVMPPPSPTVYASLDARPRSIYDVLDCSAAEAEPTIEKTNSKKREMLKTVEPKAERQDEGAFESVYENF